MRRIVMATREMTMAPPVDARSERFRQAELAMWNRFGLNPTERYVELDSPRLRLRVLEVGTGEPLLFVHGTAGPGAWPSLIRELKGYRCLILDRPGWGMSSALDFSKHQFGAVTASVLRGVLDGLRVERAVVIGNSIGDVWALRLAAQHPSRVSHLVLLGGGPIVPEVEVPGIIRLIASPVGAIIVRLPVSPGRVRSILKAGGHGPSLDAGRLDDFVEWRVAMGRDTDSMRSERAMVRTLIHGRAWRPGLTFNDDELAAIEPPALFVYGTADPVGSAELWGRVVGLLPHGQLQLVDNAAHEPWIEDPGGVASRIVQFVNG
jgi:2-hydroxy-6-oxonona-2,4-dienedioate hydrolase